MSHSSAVDTAAVCKFESFSALLAEENKGTLLDVAREVLRRENPDSWRTFSGCLAHDLVHGNFLTTVGWGGRNKTKLLQLLQEGLKDLVTKSSEYFLVLFGRASYLLTCIPLITQPICSLQVGV